MMPRCSGLKKQKTDACVIKTIKAAAAPSAVVRDCSNEQKKESKRDFFGYKVEVCRYVFSRSAGAPAGKVRNKIKRNLL